MSLTLNNPDLSKLWVPDENGLLDFCHVRSHAARNRWIIYTQHFYDLNGVCINCGKLRKDVEPKQEAKAQRENIKEL
jgi:hypothetical protein